MAACRVYPSTARAREMFCAVSRTWSLSERRLTLASMIGHGFESVTGQSEFGGAMMPCSA